MRPFAHLSPMPEFVRQVPEGDDRERLICPECGHVDYENPKIIVGSVVAHAGRVLLCRRNIEPRRGFWTLPAGYMELGETVGEGAQREAREEACADIALDGVLAIFSISRIGQVQVIFRARFNDAHASFAAGPESQEVALFGWQDIPWGELAFPSVRWSLEAWRANPEGMLGAPVGNPDDDRRGTQRSGL
jgi:ADP-ribose pyrophosphatase YjhB (NUDIX family)